MNTPTATIFLPWHALDDALKRGARADQPDAADVPPGTLYCVTDEGAQVEQSNGVTWLLYSPTPTTGGVGTGDVIGPGVATNLAVPLFDGVSGTLLQDSTRTIASIVAEAKAPHAATHAAGASDPLTGYLATTDAALLTRRGTRASQPAASAVVAGTLYCFTDERFHIERSNGSAWEMWTPWRHAAMFSFDFSSATTEPPALNQVRFNSATYAAVTKIWVRLVTTDGRDVYYGLMGTDVGTIVRVQDQNDHTIMASFVTTGTPIDKTSYIEWPVAWFATSGAALNGGQAVLVIKQ